MKTLALSAGFSISNIVGPIVVLVIIVILLDRKSVV